VKLAIVIHHAPTDASTRYVYAQVSSRVQRIWFGWTELRLFIATWRAARRTHGRQRVSVEIVWNA
jgi:hypothetical protein